MKQVFLFGFLIIGGAIATMVSPGFASAQTNEERALVLFQQGQANYEAGNFERSALFLEEAIQLHDVAPMHYNRARALQELGRWEEAKAEYLRFLEMEPDTPERSRVESRLAILETHIQSSGQDTVEELPVHEERVGEDPVGSTQPEERESSGLSALPFLTLGAGALALGAGVGFGLAFDSSLDDADQAPSQSEADALSRDAEGQALAANLLFAIGGTLLVGGAVWLLIELLTTDESVSSMRMGPQRF